MNGFLQVFAMEISIDDTTFPLIVFNTDMLIDIDTKLSIDIDH